jgi:aminobenzoyl-glutamate utilization protein B
MIRAPYLKQVKEIVQRVDNIAEGAALMSGTSVTYQMKTGCSEYIPNHILAETADEALHQISVLSWSEEDFELARKFTDSFSQQTKSGEEETIISRYGRESLPDKLEHPLDTVIEDYDRNHMTLGFGSTDVGDVGYIAPTVHLNVATEALGTPGHSWQKAGQVNSSIGWKGMLTASKVIALASIMMLEHPERIEAARKEFLKKNNGVYDCPVAGVTELPEL